MGSACTKPDDVPKPNKKDKNRRPSNMEPRESPAISNASERSSRQSFIP